MIESTIEDLLAGLPLGALRYFDSIGSTNEEALRWARVGAPHLSLVVADGQTTGRGRMGRRWFTSLGSALAFSVILLPEGLPAHHLTRLTALGALAVVTALQKDHGLDAKIKWPNDVLAGGRKLSGVLVEAEWQGPSLEAAVLGIGINVARESVPPADALLFPATCVEAVLDAPLDRWALLRSVLEALLGWLPRLASPGVVKDWESRLAYLGQNVGVLQEGGEGIEGKLLGLQEDGALRLGLATGEEVYVQAGDVHLRPADVDRDEKRE
jgi:BirA family biotin operon repressor/biotin-[acetyl-CoA-carboxylase] ligase